MPSLYKKASRQSIRLDARALGETLMQRGISVIDAVAVQSVYINNASRISYQEKRDMLRDKIIEACILAKANNTRVLAAAQMAAKDFFNIG